mmetsp:Transcript_33975/g.106996  ORF Transcript_33975/g.106996 Transcript_33975/m.106996 type:complete len:211 (+) Transcript_33975:213-845(+)
MPVDLGREAGQGERERGVDRVASGDEAESARDEEAVLHRDDEGALGVRVACCRHRQLDRRGRHSDGAAHEEEKGAAGSVLQHLDVPQDGGETELGTQNESAKHAEPAHHRPHQQRVAVAGALPLAGEEVLKGDTRHRQRRKDVGPLRLGSEPRVGSARCRAAREARLVCNEALAVRLDARANPHSPSNGLHRAVQPDTPLSPGRAAGWGE